MPWRSQVRRQVHRMRVVVSTLSHETRARQHSTNFVDEMLVSIGVHAVLIVAVGVVTCVGMQLLIAKSKVDFFW